MMTRFARGSKDEHGQALVLAVVVLGGLIAIAGLAVDGGLLFAQRRDLQNIADGAALAGAMQLDERAYRASGAVTLDTTAAQAAATAYVASESDVAFTVAARNTDVEVDVSRQAATGFLRIVGIGSMSIRASARAEARHGIEAAR